MISPSTPPVSRAVDSGECSRFSLPPVLKSICFRVSQFSWGVFQKVTGFLSQKKEDSISAKIVISEEIHALVQATRSDSQLESRSDAFVQEQVELADQISELLARPTKNRFDAEAELELAAMEAEIAKQAGDSAQTSNRVEQSENELALKQLEAELDMAAEATENGLEPSDSELLRELDAELERERASKEAELVEQAGDLVGTDNRLQQSDSEILRELEADFEREMALEIQGVEHKSRHAQPAD